MDIDIAPDHADFREEVRSWLSEHLVGDFAEHRGIGSPTDDAAVVMFTTLRLTAA